MQSAELFQHGAFGISAAEASAMDPQQRLLLERGYEALHGAGLGRRELLGSTIAVNVGQWESEFASVVVRTAAGRSVYASTGYQCAVTCGRVSFVLGLRGPCASFNTACSASLVASHSSVRALQYGECEGALSAGVNMLLSSDAMQGNATAGFTSVAGRSHTFDARADGYARGEAIDAIAGERADDDGTRLAPHQVGSAVRQDGRSASLTAPSGQAQQGLLVAALADARHRPEEVAVLEAHGTGTALGDPIEAGSLTAVLLSRGDGVRGSLAVGSLKANAGHTEPGAGLAGTLKLLTQLVGGVVSPNAQLRALNGHVVGALHGGSVAMPEQLARVRPSPVAAMPMPKKSLKIWVGRTRWCRRWKPRAVKLKRRV